MPPEPKLNRDEILIAEYEYIASTIAQANEDRSRVASFYFVTVGSLVAAILSSQLSSGSMRNVSIAFAGLFAVLTILGSLTLAQLARLRAAWHESAEAMNQLKEFYIQHQPGIEGAFKWRTRTLPATDKPFSIANLMAGEVAFLSAITTAAALYFLLFAMTEVSGWMWAAVGAAFVLAYFAQWRWYKHLLVDNQ